MDLHATRDSSDTPPTDPGSDVVGRCRRLSRQSWGHPAQEGSSRFGETLTRLQAQLAGEVLHEDGTRRRRPWQRNPKGRLPPGGILPAQRPELRPSDKQPAKSVTFYLPDPWYAVNNVARMMGHSCKQAQSFGDHPRVRHTARAHQ